MQSPPPTEPALSPPRPPLVWRQRLFLVAVFPLLLLGAVELLLRFAGYGPDTRFVVTRLVRPDGTRIMGVNPLAYRRFHFQTAGLNEAGTRFAGWREFTRPKPAGGYRVFFLGGSTVEGYPHLRNACAPAFLEVLLAEAMPGRQVEAVNCGVTAITSFSLREWAPAVLRHEADALVVYAGHNEFYGAYGAGSTSSIGTRRSVILAHLALRRLRLAQALTGLTQGLASIGGKRSGGLMARVARDRAIPLDDPQYAACRGNFRANLADIVRIARARGVPVYLCGLVSNERDLVPFVSMHRTDLSEVERASFDDLFAAGLAEIGRASWRQARSILEEASRIDDRHAETVYRLAQCSDRLGDAETARRLYERARDLDGLRFRATAGFTTVIREVCDAEGGVYVDVPAAFAGAAETPGLIGWDLMTDHLHPNERGQYLIARAVAEAVLAGENGGEPRREDLPSFDAAAERLGLGPVDTMNWKVTVFLLTRGFPFAGPSNDAWNRRLEREILEWQTGLAGPMKEGHRAWSVTPRWDTIHYHFAEAFRRHDQFADALRWFRAADARSDPHSPAAARARARAAQCAAAMGLEDAAEIVTETLVYLDECIAMSPDDRPELRALRAEVAALRQGNPSARERSSSLELRHLPFSARDSIRQAVRGRLPTLMSSIAHGPVRPSSQTACHGS